MKAVVFHAYGGNDVIGVTDMPKLSPGPDEVLIRVHAAGVNPVDWKIRQGEARFLTGWKFPKILGIECSGEIVETGAHITKFKAGDAVISTGSLRLGAYAEYTAVLESRAFLKPESISFEEAAAIPIAGMTAAVALRDKGRIEAGKKVLINGASGGVGTFAVQIAKLYNADVTGVCSAGNAGLVKDLGADRVIDYREQDFTKTGERYDIIFDTVSSRSFSECRKALTANGVYINTLPSLSIFWDIFATSLLPGKKAATIMVGHKKADMDWLCGHLETGRLKVILDRVYPLEQVKEALNFSETGRVRGKVVLKVI
jgi:NADPH:quinone reductase-like Zn-dependent oxidoreductase